jgi:hypothetical protein
MGRRNLGGLKITQSLMMCPQETVVAFDANLLIKGHQLMDSGT